MKAADFPIDVLEALDGMHPTQRKFFDQMVKNGQAPRMAAMLACRTAPKSKTDDDFARSFGPNGKQYENEPRAGDFFVNETRKKYPNFSPAGYIHMPELCKKGEPGDIEAWVPRNGARGYIKKLCEKRGMGLSDGAGVNVPVRLSDEQLDDTYKIADSIVEREAKKEMIENPKLKIQEAREKVRAERTPKDLKRSAPKAKKG